MQPGDRPQRRPLPKPPQPSGLRAKPPVPPRPTPFAAPSSLQIQGVLGDLARKPDRAEVLNRLSPTDLTHLQQIVGNQAVRSVVTPAAPTRPAPPPVPSRQTKPPPVPAVEPAPVQSPAVVTGPSGRRPGLFGRIGALLKGTIRSVTSRFVSSEPAPPADFVVSRPSNPPVHIGSAQGPGSEPAPPADPAHSSGRSEAEQPRSDHEPTDEEHELSVGSGADRSLDQAVASLPPDAVLTLEQHLASHPPAQPQGKSPGQAVGPFKLPAALARAADTGEMMAPRSFGPAEMAAWIAAGDGSRTAQAQAIVTRVSGGKSLKADSPAARRVRLAQNMLLSYMAYGIGSYEQAVDLAARLGGNLGAATFDDLSPDVQGALRTIGYSKSLDRIEAYRMDNDLQMIGRITRTASAALEEQEKHVKELLGVTVPSFFELVPEASRSKGGSQIAQINRLGARLVWQYEKRPALGRLAALPPMLHEDDPVIRWGEVAQRYQGLVNELQIQANRLLPGEMGAGKTGQELQDATEKGRRTAEARGDLFSAGSGALERRGERYMPERVPFGLQQAQATESGPGRLQAPTETSKADLDNMHKAELDQARKEMKDMLARQVPAFVVQRYASDVVDLLLKQFHVEALQEMQAAGWGTPPSEYAFLALGSGGRQEHTSFGDLDVALVVGSTTKSTRMGKEKRTSKEYFQELGRRMAAKANGLGERGAAAQSGKERKGLRICEGGVFPAPSGQMPYGPEVLIGTPEELARIQRRPGWITFNQADIELGADAELFDALREPRFAFGSGGGVQLAQQYQGKLARTLTEKGKGGQSRAVESGRVAIEEATTQMGELPSPGSLDADGAQLNVKKLSRPIQLYIKGMCLCAEITVANTRERVKALHAKGHLDATLAKDVLDAVEALAGWRLKGHLESMEQDDVVSTVGDQSGSRYALDDEDRARARAIISTAIPALAEAAQLMVSRG